MDITPLVPKGRQVITGYGGGGFKINQERVDGSVLIFVERTLSWNGVLDVQSLAPVLESKVELLLIGTGAQAMPLPADLRASLKAASINVEMMDTGAACRTYNVVMAEERRVAAALIAV